MLGPVSKNQVQHFKNLDGCELASDIIYLGRAGCYRTHSLTIAYMSGIDGTEDYQADYRRLKTIEVSTKCEDSNFLGVDILLTTDWPKGIVNNVQCSSELTDMRSQGSKMAAFLANKLRPRYHFASYRGIFYERVPYRNHRVACETSRHVTRFISLADVGNLEKKKWLYAFNIIPIIEMSNTELVAQPNSATDIPFTDNDMVINTNEQNTQFFYSTNYSYDDKNRKRKPHAQSKEDPKKQRTPSTPCWFCLSGAEVEKHLIISIGNHCYVALPKGGLTPYHVLILPITHHPSTLELPEEVHDEMEQFKSALKKCFKKTTGQVPIFFERNYKSQHLQLQVVPIPKDLAANAKLAFEECAEDAGLELVDMPEHASLCQMAQPGTPYFYVETSNKLRLFHRVNKGFPIQFGREVLASKHLLDAEERIDWKECKVSKEEEIKIANDFRKIFEPFDFTLDESSD